ncbi:DUF1841 family protein [Amycolatopsis suaedae]|uniref:DUF1841 family protein n=1 Tax=Amycolatopsis suaedae TaxID=2510978 RepID=UPI0013EEF572|nr:DUF1841 family protein [Amycolatopsis suaedae]
MSASPLEMKLPEHGVDVAAYLEDLPPQASVDEIQEVLDRRMFVMPYYGTTIRGEDYPRLNPADPDERRLLIEGEHPEYHDALADPAWDGEIDGVNPRLHLAMHEVIANQLWADDPPEAWRAARRLRGQGTDRHDVLHELMGVMVEHMHPTVVRHEPFDPEAYRRALNGLGGDSAAVAGRPPSHKTYRIKVSIAGSEPMIWRRLSLPGDTTLDVLHRVIQVAFGWEDCHLHAFEAKGRRYAAMTYEPLEGALDERAVTLAELAPRKSSRLRYTYDFGDDWVHDIVVEATEPMRGEPTVVCLDAGRAGPPEDSGGVWGYLDLLEAVADPAHPEHDDRLEWLGEGFDPAAVDRDAINAMLAACGSSMTGTAL